MIYADLVDANMCTDACPCDEAHKDKLAGVEGVDTMVFKPAGDGVFAKFSDCYANAKNKPAGKSAEVSQKAKEWMEKTGIKAVELMELSFAEEKCASMCTKGKFYFTRSIEDGPPETDCLSALVGSMQSMPAGAIALLSGLALIVAGIGGFPLCTGFNEKNDEPE